MGHDIPFFSHGGSYEWVAQDAGFEVLPVPPMMSRERAKQYMAFNGGEVGNPFRDSFLTYEELKEYVPCEAGMLRDAKADVVIIGWNLPSYLSVRLVGIPIVAQRPDPIHRPLLRSKDGVFVPALIRLASLPAYELVCQLDHASATAVDQAV